MRSSNPAYSKTLFPALIICTLIGGGAFAQDRGLCIHGHPAKRLPNCPTGVVKPGICISYGGLVPMRGYQRDHGNPLELGGLDIASNVHYQRAREAAIKDRDEHLAGEKMCSGHWFLDYARTWLAQGWPVDAAHGYDQETKTQ